MLNNKRKCLYTLIYFSKFYFSIRNKFFKKNEFCFSKFLFFKKYIFERRI